jgi:hypothetical protein
MRTHRGRCREKRQPWRFKWHASRFERQATPAKRQPCPKKGRAMRFARQWTRFLRHGTRFSRQGWPAATQDFCQLARTSALFATALPLWVAACRFSRHGPRFSRQVVRQGGAWAALEVPTLSLWMRWPPLNRMEDGQKGGEVLQNWPRATWVATPAARERTKTARTGRTAKQTGRGAMCDRHWRDGCRVGAGLVEPRGPLRSNPCVRRMPTVLTSWPQTVTGASFWT